MRTFKHKATFASVLKCVPDADKNLNLSRASVQDLKAIIPADAGTFEDLLPIAANACVVNMVNKNGDVIDTATAISIYKNFLNKHINVEHDREQVVGHIVNVALSKFDSNYATGVGSEIVEASTLQTDGKLPFNISVAGYVYKIIAPNVVEKILESNDPNSPLFLQVALSWELGFDNYKIVLNDNTANAKLIEDEKEIERYTPFLKTSGGSGQTGDGQTVSRLIYGSDVLPLGVALTFSPAAHVKGVVTTKDSVAAITPVATEGQALVAASTTTEENNIEINQQITSQSTAGNVTHIITKSMKVLKSFEDVQGLNDETVKEYSFANIGAILTTKVDEIVRTHQKTIDDQKAVAAQAVEDAKTQKATVAKLEKEVADLKDSQAKVVAEQEFNDRMSGLDEQFELDAEDRSAIAAEIKGFTNEEFTAWASRFAKYAKFKAKAYIEEQKKKTASASVALDPAAVAAQALAAASVVTAPLTVGTVQTASDNKAKYATAFKAGEGVIIEQNTRRK